MTKNDLRMIRHTQVITDPFPEQTEYQYKKEILKFWSVKPESISIWAAYMKGYNKAYSEIEERLND